MRIIRGRDYYDNALAHGRDDSVVFVRERERFIADKDFGPRRVHYPEATLAYADTGVTARKRYRDRLYASRAGRFTVHGIDFSFDLIAVVFCGKVYNGVRIWIDGRDPMYHWKQETFDEWLAQMGLRVVRSYWEHATAFDLFACYDAPKELMGWLIEQRIVVGIRWYQRTTGIIWSVNSDQLKDVQFFKVLDAYTAFQEISMWVGGVLPSSGNQMVVISDKVRIEKHGFDSVTSFRNMNR
jgi:hypothetical protein